MKGLRTALFVSIAANILLVGVIGGAAISNARHERVATQNAVARAPNVRAVLEAVPQERRAEIRGKVIAAWREGRPARLEARRARAEVYEIANAETYDAAAVKAAFARVRAADAKVAEQLQGTIADAMTGLTVEERRAALQRLVQRRAAAGPGRRLLSPDEAPAPSVEP
ncbi:MAG: periplasmic heavy metal sensor [Alphaproteobacteria bacterium]|mgnify:CR=1 FL=1|nr:periplasmic heavy metal sensor [Alphaproteobacteria bacterium]